MVNKLGTGVTDFFYLPAKGAVQSPAMFGIGLAKGSLSLVRGTLSGVFGTVGSITGSVSKGLAMASLDDRFIEKSAKKQQDAPKHAAAGLFEGGKSLGMGLFKGVTGLVTGQKQTSSRLPPPFGAVTARVCFFSPLFVLFSSRCLL
jgi:hypothetical protein